MFIGKKYNNDILLNVRGLRAFVSIVIMVFCINLPFNVATLRFSNPDMKIWNTFGVLK